MKYVSFLLLLTLSMAKAFPQISYTKLDDLNSLCKKEDFEAAKKFLKINGYEIYEDNENYDHGSYFVLAEIQARINIGKFKSYISDNIYDQINVNFYEYDDSKELTTAQSLTTDNLSDISDLRKFRPLTMWAFEDWDYVRDRNVWKDSVWEAIDNKINSDRYRNYFSSKKFRDKNEFDVTFRKNDIQLGERKEYNLTYEYQDFSKDVAKEYSPLSISTSISLKTIIDKGKNITSPDKNIIAFPLIKSGPSYLIKLKFGNIIKTYILDSGASDMTLDNETYNDLKATGQLKIKSTLTKRTYTLADGSLVEYERVQIPSFSINKIIVKEINAVIVENGKPLLLGKSFLDSFKSWKVDNKNNTLIVEVF